MAVFMMKVVPGRRGRKAPTRDASSPRRHVAVRARCLRVHARRARAQHACMQVIEHDLLQIYTYYATTKRVRIVEDKLALCLDQVRAS